MQVRGQYLHVSPGQLLVADVVYVQCKSEANTYMYPLDSYLQLM